MTDLQELLKAKDRAVDDYFDAGVQRITELLDQLPNALWLDWNERFRTACMIPSGPDFIYFEQELLDAIEEANR